MVEAVVFDVDGTLVDSVDLHALAWHEAFAHFHYAVSFEQARSQIGKGGDKLLPVFLTEQQNRDHGEDLEAWRREHFKRCYLSMVRPFCGVPELFDRLYEHKIKLAVGSSSRRDELETYLEIAGVRQHLEAVISAEDADRSKPDPDVFALACQKLGVEAACTIAVGDSPYDAMAAGRAGMRTIGLLSGCFSESALKEAGCIAIYPGPAALWACLDASAILN